MTRFALLGCLVVALGSAAAAEDKKDVPKELAPFQGTWKVVSATAGGQPAPKEAVEKLTLTFDGEKLTIKEGSKDETGSFAVDAKADPTTIDLVNPKGTKALGVYKFDKDGKLTICFNKGKDTLRPKGFDDKEAAVLVLEKVKK